MIIKKKKKNDYYFVFDKNVYLTNNVVLLFLRHSGDPRIIWPRKLYK
jgi:hypothetical protein